MNIIPTTTIHHHSILSTSTNKHSNYAIPITKPILSLASHPEFIAPFSARLKAGQLPPASQSSPTVAKLSTILSQSHSNQSHAIITTSSSYPTINPLQISNLFKNHTPPLDHLNILEIPRNKRPHSYHLQNSQSDPLDIHSTRLKRSSSQTSDLSCTSSTTALGIVSLQNSNPTPSQSPEIDQLINDFEEPESFMKPKYPLVLCHGLFGFDVLGPQALGLAYFKGVREALEKRGVEVHVARVPSIASIEDRARTLAQFIETRLPGKTVNLIGHSMGGLDSRFMITHLKPTSFKVASLTTIATPHRGSAFADHVMLDMIGMEHLPKLLQMTTALGIQGGGKAFEDLTVKNMTKFNDVTPDDPAVSYFSYGAVFRPSFGSLFKLPWQVIYEREGPNDGLVSLSSAKWANYQGTLNNVNHADLIGWTEPWRIITNPKGKTGFQVVPFYLKVIDSLARDGF